MLSHACMGLDRGSTHPCRPASALALFLVLPLLFPYVPYNNLGLGCPSYIIPSGSCRFKKGLNQTYKILITNNYFIIEF
jgi:hypothetical protein